VIPNTETLLGTRASKPKFSIFYTRIFTSGVTIYYLFLGKVPVIGVSTITKSAVENSHF
jgi:hypothetical protein